MINHTTQNGTGDYDNDDVVDICVSDDELPDEACTEDPDDDNHHDWFSSKQPLLPMPITCHQRIMKVLARPPPIYPGELIPHIVSSLGAMRTWHPLMIIKC